MNPQRASAVGLWFGGPFQSPVMLQADLPITLCAARMVLEALREGRWHRTTLVVGVVNTGLTGVLRD